MNAMVDFVQSVYAFRVGVFRLVPGYDPTRITTSLTTFLLTSGMLAVLESPLQVI